jgi:large subunit ribosomal protein L7/L12
MAKITKDELLKAIEEMSVLELAELVKAIEEKFGVSAAPMAVAAPAAGATPAGEAAPEQTTFNVVLTNAGANKIGAIKAVRELVPTLGLQEAKTLVESAPKEVLSGVNKKTAEEAKAKLTAAGATVELK